MPSLLREILLGDLVPFGNPADWSNFLVMSVLFYLLGGNFWGVAFTINEALQLENLR